MPAVKKLNNESTKSTMDEQIRNYDTCHKCGGVGILLSSDSDGENWHYDYECEHCQATRNVSFELKPYDRNNDDD